MAREADQIAQDHAAMLGSVSVITALSLHITKAVMQQTKISDMT